MYLNGLRMATYSWSKHIASYLCKGNAIPLQTWTGPEGSRSFLAPGYQDNRHMKVVRVSTVLTDSLYPQEIFLVLFSVRD